MTLEHYEATGYINERGGLEMDDREAMLAAIKRFGVGVGVVVSVAEAGKQTRSQRANRYYWSQVLTPMSKDYAAIEEAKAAS